MATRWKMLFASDNGSTYQALIDDPNYTGTPTDLKPASSPFTTQEDDDDEFFLPIRTQSGYLRFIDDDHSWQSLVPLYGKKYKVELYLSDEQDELVWQGYIQPESYEAPWERVHERQLPLVCPIAAMQGEKLNVDPDDENNLNRFCSFGEFIYLFISRSGMTIDSILFPQMLNDLNGFLGIHFNGRNYISIEENDDGTTTMKAEATYYDVLADICKLFGLTARMDGRRLIFTHFGGSIRRNYLSITYQQLRTFVTGDDITPTAVTITEKELFELSFYGTSGSMSFLPGRKTLTVEGDVNSYNNIVQVDRERINQLTGSQTVVSYVIGNIKLFLKRRTMQTIQMEGGSLYLPSPVEIMQFDETQVADLAKKHNYEWVPAVYLFFLPSGSSIRMQSSSDHAFDDGCIHVSGTFERCYISSIVARLSVGNKYWNGSAWVTPTGTAPTFTMDVVDSNEGTPNGGSAQIKTTKTLDDPWNGAEGYCAEVSSDDMLHGNVSLEIVSLNGGGASGNIPNLMTSLSIGFVHDDGDGQSSNDDSISYESTINAGFSEDWSVSNGLASHGNTKDGYAIVTDDEFRWLDMYQFLGVGTYFETPEEFVLDAAAAHYDERKRKVQFSCSDVIDSSMIIADEDTKMAVIGVGRDWIRDVFTVKAIEI